MTDAQARDEIVRVGRSLFERGLVHSTAGNLSLRLADGSLLITPTDACLGFLDPARLAHVDAQGQPLDGDPPSKTLALHRRVLAAAPQAACVLHTHSRSLVALTLMGVWRTDDILPPLTPYQAMKVGHVPLVPYHRPGDPVAADSVAGLIAGHAAAGRPLRAVMLDRLGPLVWHRDPSAAMALLEELEETAALWLLTGRSAAPLGEDRLEALRQHFGAPW